MKFKSKFDKYFTLTDNIEMKLEQVFSEYYGQVDEDMRGTLKEDDNFKCVYNAKVVIVLQNNLKTIHFNYEKSKEPTKRR